MFHGLSPGRARRAFTLIELLVVIAIIAILIALLVPAVQKVRESAARTQCSNGMRQVGIAMHSYHDVRKALPSAVPIAFYTGNWYAEAGGRDRDRSCWVASILPYVEQGPMDTQCKNWLTTLPNYTCFAPFANTHVPVLICPSDPNSPKISTLGQGAHTNYVVCHGNGYATPGGANGTNLNGLCYAKSRVTLTAIPDGSSNTVMVSEILQSPDTGAHDVRGRIWNAIHVGTVFSTIYPPNSTIGDNSQGYCNPLPMVPCGGQNANNAYLLARSGHSGGVNAVLGDCSVRFVQNSITPTVWLGMGSRNGNEIGTNE